MSGKLIFELLTYRRAGSRIFTLSGESGILKRLTGISRKVTEYGNSKSCLPGRDLPM